jgi:hypothetical protein
MILTTLSSVALTSEAYTVELSENNVDITDISFNNLFNEFLFGAVERNVLIGQIQSLAEAVKNKGVLGDLNRGLMSSNYSLIVDNIINANITGTAQTPTYPIESGSNIVGHKFSDPREIKMNVVISGKGLGDLGKTIDGSKGVKQGLIKNCETMLETWRKSSVLLKIYGKFGKKYDNFMLSGYRIKDDKDHLNLFEAELVFKEAQKIEKTTISNAVSCKLKKSGIANTVLNTESIYNIDGGMSFPNMSYPE